MTGGGIAFRRQMILVHAPLLLVRARAVYLRRRPAALHDRAAPRTLIRQTVGRPSKHGWTNSHVDGTLLPTEGSQLFIALRDATMITEKTGRRKKGG